METTITLQCPDCKRRNYTTVKNKKNDPDRLELKKYCRWCRKHTAHRETRQPVAITARRRTRAEQEFGVFRFLRETYEELRKVVWPTPQELYRYTLVVIVTVIVIAAF